MAILNPQDMLGLGKTTNGEMHLSRRKNYYKRIEIHLEDLELCINNQHQSPKTDTGVFFHQMYLSCSSRQAFFGLSSINLHEKKKFK